MAANIKLLDGNGQATIYEGIETMSFDTDAEGEKATFTHGTASTTSVELDFTKGDQVIVPEEGNLLIEVTVKKPVALVPENILKGVNIGGIIGVALTTEDIIIKEGSFTPSVGKNYEESHDLGVLPDILIIWCLNGANGYLSSALGFCNDMISSLEMMPRAYYLTSDGNMVEYATENGHEESSLAAASSGQLNGVNPKSFIIGGTSVPLNTSSRYEWLAIGGLMDHSDYLFLTSALNGKGDLIISGGVSSIEQINIYVDGELKKTVDYVHDEEFVIDLSDVTTALEEHTISYDVTGDGLSEQYTRVFCDKSSGYVISEVSGTCGDGLTWTYNISNGALTISGDGAMDDYDTADQQPWYNYASDITNVVVENGVTHTGARAFQYLAMSSITLPDTLTSIGRNMIYQCPNITSVTIPEGITSIPVYFAYNCSNLTSVTLPSTLTSIGQSAFRDTGITNIDIPYGVMDIGIWAFAGADLTSVAIPSSMTKISDYCFGYCTSLASVDIPEGITTIGASAFRQSGLVSVDIPYGVTSLGERAFNDITTLTSLTIPETVTSFGKYSICGCTSLTGHFTIPEGTTELGFGTFRATPITSITLPESLLTIGAQALYETDITSITIPANVTTIGSYAFAQSTLLTEAIFEDTTTWKRYSSETATSGYSISSSNLELTGTAATYLRSTYTSYWWRKT